MVILRLLRIKQWIKNMFIVFPLIFSGQFLDMSLWLECIKAFLGFSFLAGSFYVLNDILDRSTDALNPEKSNRPIASGEITVPKALVYGFIFLAVSILFLLNCRPAIWMAVIAYMGLQVLYNFFTKHWVILDVMTIACGFLTRVWLGALAVGISPSVWLQLCVFMLALFLGFTKRRYELVMLKDTAVNHRRALHDYTLNFIDQMVMISSTVTIVFYGLYTISSDVIKHVGNLGMLYSIAFVIYGMFRYLFLVHVKKAGGDPSELLLKDTPLFMTILAWIIFVVILIMLTGPK